jgi:hypothetical protein
MLIPQSSGRSKVRKEGKLIEFGVGLPLNISIDTNITKAIADLSFRIAKANWRTRSKLARTNLRSTADSAYQRGGARC